MDPEAAAVENARHCYRDSDSEQELLRDACEFDEWQRQQQHAANDAMAAEAMEALAAEPVEEPVEPPPLADTAPSHGDVPTGPAEPQNSARAGKARRQYCWWLTFSYPYQETVVRLGLKTPDDFTREELLEVIKFATAKAKWKLVEAAFFLEYHQRTDAVGRRLPHLNALCRFEGQHAWSSLAKILAKEYHVRVDFGDNIRNWYDGAVYGAVSSDHKLHKPAEELDPEPLQWASAGIPTPFAEVLPAKWHKQGRQPKLSKLQVLLRFLFLVVSGVALLAGGFFAFEPRKRAGAGHRAAAQLKH